MDVAGSRRLRSAQASACLGCGQKVTVGTAATASAVDPDPRPPRFRDTPSGGRHPGEGTETLREISRAPEGQQLGASQAPSGAQNGRLTQPVLQVRLLSRKAAVLSCPLSVKRQAK